MTLFTNSDCLGVVLAGGLSSRMGQDKAQLPRNNNSMLEFSKQILSDSGVNNVVVSGDNYDVPDTIKESGPVGGILSVLSRFPDAKSLLILPVDLPFMTAKALTELRLKGELSQKATYFQGHNIPLYLPNNAYVELFLAQAFSNQGSQKISNDSEIVRVNSQSSKKGPSIKALLKKVPHQAIQSSDTNTLLNTNTPQEWQQAKKQFNFS
jgi:molybdopterin-guanine dinucleotide biosynthesis protein A